MSLFSSLKTLLVGKKSYIVAVVFALYETLKTFGLNVSPEQNQAILVLLATLFGVSMAAKVNRISAKLK